MSLSSDINTTSTALSDIKNAIIAKGVTPSGNITTYATAIGNISGGSSPVIESLSITPSTLAQTIEAPSSIDGYSPINVSAVTSNIDQNITAENIKNGVSILGITGNYQGTIPTVTLNVTPADAEFNVSYSPISFPSGTTSLTGSNVTMYLTASKPNYEESSTSFNLGSSQTVTMNLTPIVWSEEAAEYFSIAINPQGSYSGGVTFDFGGAPDSAYFNQKIWIFKDDNGSEWGLIFTGSAWKVYYDDGYGTYYEGNTITTDYGIVNSETTSGCQIRVSLGTGSSYTGGIECISFGKYQISNVGTSNLASIMEYMYFTDPIEVNDDAYIAGGTYGGTFRVSNVGVIPQNLYSYSTSHTQNYTNQKYTLLYDNTIIIETGDEEMPD